MAKRPNQDIAGKQFWENRERFADLFNAFFFNGEPVIDPRFLQERNSEVASNIPLGKIYEHVKKYEDVTKVYQGTELSILGIENQADIHYAMPLRSRLYDDLDYLKECAALVGIRRADKVLSKKEWLSGMTKEDQLHMSLRIVIYYGEETWDGPRKLSDMVKIPDIFRPYFQDYEMPLVCINERENYERIYRNESVKNLMTQLYLLYCRDWEKIRDMDVCLDYDTANILSAVTGNKILIKAASQKKGGIRMCSALEELRREGVEEGRREGVEEGRKKGVEEGRKEMICSMLLTGMTSEQVAKIAKMTVEEIEKIKRKYKI